MDAFVTGPLSHLLKGTEHLAAGQPERHNGSYNAGACPCHGIDHSNSARNRIDDVVSHQSPSPVLVVTAMIKETTTGNGREIVADIEPGEPEAEPENRIGHPVVEIDIISRGRIVRNNRRSLVIIIIVDVR